MSTSVVPETKVETPSNPPSQEPSKPPIDTNKEINDLQMKVIADKERENRELRAKLTRMEEAEKNKEQAPPSAKKSDAELNAEYFRNPAQTLRDVMDATIAPLAKKVDNAVDYVNQNRTRDTKVQLKDQFRNDPRYKARFATLEPVLDKMMEMHQESGGQVNYDTMHNAILSSIGLIASGQINGISFDSPAPNNAPPNREAPPNNNPPPNSEARPVVTPPHLMPSSPPPLSKPKSAVRELSENERLLARARGWTPEQYLEMQGEPTEKMVITDFGQAGQKKRRGGK